MRPHAFLLCVLYALAAHAATIPNPTSETVEKKLDVFQDENHKTPEIAPVDQEQIDQTNVINDVDNKLRIKPAEIPVDVQNVEQSVKTSEESEEIIRPPVDLRNPGLPQRQEHETQNPEFYAAEQNFVEAYKKNLHNAQAFLKQGFQGVSDGIKNVFENNEQLQGIQDRIQNLREGFISQISKLNGTVQTFIHADSANDISPDDENTKSNIQIIETGLNTIKEDFTKGVDTLAGGVEILSSVKSQNSKQDGNQSSSSTTAAPANPPTAGLGNFIFNYITDINNNLQGSFANITNSFNNFFTQGQNVFRPGATAAPAGGQPAGTQADAPTPPPFGGFGSGSGPIAQAIQSFQNAFYQNVITPIQNAPSFAQFTSTTSAPANSAQPEKPAQTDNQNDPVALEDQGSRVTQPTAAPAPVTQAAPVTRPGPIRQLLQNNPISQGIAATVQRLQNINNPEKPRETIQLKSAQDLLSGEDEKKGHSNGSGDNNHNSDSGSSSGVNESAPSNEIQKDALPEEEVKEQKTEEVIVKTE